MFIRFMCLNLSKCVLVLHGETNPVELYCGRMGQGIENRPLLCLANFRVQLGGTHHGVLGCNADHVGFGKESDALGLDIGAPLAAQPRGSTEGVKQDTSMNKQLLTFWGTLL